MRLADAYELALETLMADFTHDLPQLSDETLVERAERKIWLSAFAGNNPRSKYHAEADACHDEAVRRAKPWLYQRAWNAAYRACGYEPSSDEIRLAETPDHAD